MQSTNTCASLEDVVNFDSRGNRSYTAFETNSEFMASTATAASSPRLPNDVSRSFNFPTSLLNPRRNKACTLPVKISHRATTLTRVTGGRVESLKAAVGDEEGDGVRRLQNGPDVRGVALEGEEGRAVDLTPQAVEAIAESFAEWVAERKEGDVGLADRADGETGRIRVSFGRDPRLSGRRLSAAVFAGLGRAGCDVFDMGLATTPACFMSTVLPPFRYDASIMMTASHLPYTRNGMKFFTKRGGLTSTEMEEICERAAGRLAAAKKKMDMPPPPPPPPPRVVTRVDFMSAYAQHLRSIIIQRVAHPTNYHAPLKGFKVVVNAGNGSGGFFAWDVLEALGADTSGSLHLEPDGRFPNHMPNPEDPTAMSLTREATLGRGGDLGVVFDTDVDRCGVVAAGGAAINGDRLIALMAAIVLREHPGTTVVTDARTSVALSEFIATRGGRHCLYRVGYRNVIDMGVQLNRDGVDAHLMMETTGHGALKENYFLDDGAYMVVKIIIEMVRMKLMGIKEGIESLIEDLQQPVESVELRMNILTHPKNAKEKGREVIEGLKKHIQEGQLPGWELDTCGNCWVSEGCLADSNDVPAVIDAYMYRVRIWDEVHGQHGWIHIRQSVHNPNIALNMQSTVAGGCLSIAKVLLHRFLMANGLQEYLDVTQVINFATKGMRV